MGIKREKLPIPGQIEHMKKKGIKFEKMSEADASRFLQNNNYYFKLKAYCKNYGKNVNGEYQDLDFAYLVDLSTIDMHLRKFIIKVSLDVEHFLKVKLLRDFLLDGSEDGLKFYRIIADRAPEYLNNGGMLFLEIGYDQGAEVSALLSAAGFMDVEVIKDLSGLDRVVSGRIGLI